MGCFVKQLKKLKTIIELPACVNTLKSCMDLIFTCPSLNTLVRRVPRWIPANTVMVTRPYIWLHCLETQMCASCCWKMVPKFMQLILSDAHPPKWQLLLVGLNCCYFETCGGFKWYVNEMHVLIFLIKCFRKSCLRSCHKQLCAKIRCWILYSYKWAGNRAKIAAFFGRDFTQICHAGACLEILYIFFFGINIFIILL